MSENDELFLVWMCDQVAANRDCPVVQDKYLGWIKDQVRFLRKLAVVGTTASQRDDFNNNKITE